MCVLLKSFISNTFPKPFFITFFSFFWGLIVTLVFSPNAHAQAVSPGTTGIYGTTFSFTAVTGTGQPNFETFPCGPNFSQTCSGGYAGPAVPVSWTVDNAAVNATYYTTTDNPYYCADGDNGQQLYCDSITGQSGYSSVLTPGSHVVTAFISSSDDPYTAFSYTWNITVTGSGPMPTTTSVSSSATTTSYGAPLVLSAQVSSTGSSVATGVVNFFDGGVVIGGATLKGGAGSMSASSLSPGSHTITAQYFGDALNDGSSGFLGSSINVQSGPPPTTISLYPTSSISGSPIRALVNVTSSPGHIAQGYVSCLSGSISAGPQALDSNGQALLTINGLSIGNNTVTCNYTSSVNSDQSSSTANATVATQGFTNTGNLTIARASHTATQLSNGRILIAGGRTSGQNNDGNLSLATAELYDSATGISSPTSANLNTARHFHTATLLPDGSVLLVGGTSFAAYTSTAEYYDPTTGTFKVTGSMLIGRSHHTATLLKNGKVLIAGGSDTNNTPTTEAELYDPLSGTFTVTGSMHNARSFHTSTLLPDGRVLLVGGNDSSTVGLATAELYDPSNGTFTQTGNLNAARENHTATVLPNGTVLIVGGDSGSFTPTTSAEVFSPSSGTFSSTAGLGTARYAHTATQLNDGTILISGGIYSSFNETASSEIFNPATMSFSAASNMNTARAFATSTAFGTNGVLNAGGVYNSSASPTASAETFAYSVDSGGIDPKYIVLGVIYAPPGSGSNVSYGVSNLVSTTTSIDNLFTNSTSVIATSTVGANLTVGPFSVGGTGTLTTTGSYAYSKDNNSSLTLSRSGMNMLRVNGPQSSGIGVDHDYDLISVWLNPVVNLSIPASINNVVDWNGYTYNASDRNNNGNPDVINLPVICLKNPYLTSCKQYQIFTSRAWDVLGGLNLTDYAAILQRDPFIVNPNFDPASDPSNRYAVQSGTIGYPVPAPGQGGQQYSSTLTASSANTTGTSSTDQYTVGFSLDTKVTGGFLSSITSDLKTTNTTTWTNKASSTQTLTNGQTAAYTIATPAASDNYTGPIQFNAWLDNIYGSFMFFAATRSTVPAANVGLSLSSISFPGATLVGNTSSPVQVTVTNNSSVPLQIDLTKGGGITFSKASFSLAPGSDTCTGSTLASQGSCTIYVQFAPTTDDSNPTGTTSISGTMIVGGIEMAPGSTNLLITAQLPLDGTATR